MTMGGLGMIVGIGFMTRSFGRSRVRRHVVLPLLRGFRENRNKIGVIPIVMSAKAPASALGLGGSL